MNLILLESVDFMPGNTTAVLRGSRARHIVEVLKKGAGDILLAGILNGPVGTVRILSATAHEVIIERPKGEQPPIPPVDLILSMPRPKVMKRLWSPIASLGVRSITIIGGEKVEPCYFASHATDPETYRPRLIEGLEQARDTHIPVVQIVDSFERFSRDVLPGFSGASYSLIAEPGTPRSICDIITRRPSTPTTLAVGPEGGWSSRERETFLARGFHEISLGPRALRTDTAVIGLLTLIHEAIRN